MRIEQVRLHTYEIVCIVVYEFLYLDLGDALDLNHRTWASWELPGLDASSSWLRVGQELRRWIVSDSDLLR